jgi:fructokinase
LTYQVICFGEVLWDLLPNGRVAGGAPMNVAFQLTQLGTYSGMISRVGSDALGLDLMEFFFSKEIPVKFIQVDARAATGIVHVTLDAQGSPSYEIVQPVAWDFIEPDAYMLSDVAAAEVFVFGSLVARSAKSRNALEKCLAVSKWRVFDVNFRAPFIDRDYIDKLMKQAHMVKMNDDELDLIAQWFGLSGGQSERMSLVRDLYQLEVLAVTRGAQGAIVLTNEGFVSHTGYQVDVCDTIGSGDAFLAGYLSQWLSGKSPAVCLDFACKMGAFLAAQKGGTPILSIEKVNAYFS